MVIYIVDNLNKKLFLTTFLLILWELELYGAHTPCAASQLLICFVSVFTVTCSYIYIHRGYTINFAGKEELCCCSDFAAIVCILFIAYSWHFWLAVYVAIIRSIASVLVRLRERSKYGACICKELLWVWLIGVTKQEARFIAFVVPFGQPWRTYARFLSISDTLTTSSTRKFAQNSGSGDFRADDDNDNDEEPITLPLCACTRGKNGTSNIKVSNDSTCSSYPHWEPLVLLNSLVRMSGEDFSAHVDTCHSVYLAWNSLVFCAIAMI